jgi:hypothetical protein
MPTDTIKWIEINLKILDTINDNRSIIGYTEGSHRWLVVVLLSAVRYSHRTPSCDHQCSRCRPLLLPIVIQCRHRCRCRCHRAATASTATTVVKLAIAHCQRKRQQQQQHQHTNGSTNVKMFTSPDDWTYLTYLQYRGNSAITKLLAKKNLDLFCNLHTCRCLALRFWEVVQ